MFTIGEIHDNSNLNLFHFLDLFPNFIFVRFFLSKSVCNFIGFVRGLLRRRLLIFLIIKYSPMVIPFQAI